MGNSREDGGKSDSHVVFHYGFRESLADSCFVDERVVDGECYIGGGDYMTAAAIIKFYLKKFQIFLFFWTPVKDIRSGATDERTLLPGTWAIQYSNT